MFGHGRPGSAVDHVTQRFWNWLGTIPHLHLFRSYLRSASQLWSQTVIYTSLLGTFLTVSGSISAFSNSSAARRRSRSRLIAAGSIGITWSGSSSGYVALTWAFSGMVSMNPWGFLEGGAVAARDAARRGRRPSGARSRLDRRSAQGAVLAMSSVLSSAPFGGKLYWLATLRRRHC